MTFPDCFVGAYVGWSTQAWIMYVAAAAIMPALVSLPFWYRRSRSFGIMAIGGFAGFMSIHGTVPCLSGKIPDWLAIILGVGLLAVVLAMYVAVFRGPRRPEADGR